MYMVILLLFFGGSQAGKYSSFNKSNAFKFLTQICGFLVSAAGAYGMYFTAVELHGAKESLELVYIVITDLSGVLLAFGVVIWLVSFAGCIGALRENLCLLKMVSATVPTACLLSENTFGALIF